MLLLDEPFSGLDRAASRSLAAFLRKVVAGDHYAQRTRYDAAIARIDEAFDRDLAFYGFYESLFDRGTLKDLCGFLGIDFHEPDLGRQVNVSPKEDGELSEATVRALVELFAPVYAAVGARFPDVDLPALWPSMRLL